MRLPARALLAALATVLPLAVVPVATSSPAAAAPTSWSLEGYGNGHGRGMSQWGAEGAASKGLTYRQILAFYYPGTSVGTAKGAVRVLLTAATRPGLVIDHRKGLTVRSTRTGTSYPLERKDAWRWRLSGSADNSTTVVSVRGKDTGWTVVRRIPGEAEFMATSMRLYLGSGAKVYRGRLRSAAVDGKRVVVNVLSMDNYLKGVVPLEVYPTWHRAALRAQAVAARTYAAFERDAGGRGHFDVYDTTQSQVYGGVGAEVASTTAAVAATAGEVRTYGGKPAFTQFSSSNGGWTVAGTQAYLKAKQDTYDPLRPWTDTVTAAEVQRAWPAVGTVTGLAVTERDGNGRYGGRALSVRITGTKKTLTVDGSDFRSRMGLFSTLFRFV